MGLPYKLAVVSATVLSTALMFNLSTPFITELTISDLATIWTTLISWLKPPYLYVVINCIIIIIVASSRLQSKVEGSPSVYTPTTEPVLIQTGSVKGVHHVQENPPVHEPKILFHNDVFVDEPVEITSPEFVQILEQDFSTPTFSYEDMKIATKAYAEIKKNKVNKSVISMSTWTPTKIDQVDLSFPLEKPPASARFGHRKPTKATSEAGGRTLKVTKPKRQDTLETTWKTITEGRSVPLTRHLRKSDTFETHGQGRPDPNFNELPIDNHSERMTKSDTFDVVTRNGGGSRKPPPPQSKLSRAGGSGRLRKDPSLGQEELNRKVEAFIKKFNEDMRLQRQESMNQYMEMINRGAH